MNKVLKISFLLVVLLIVSCDNNDDGSIAPLTDGFTYNNTFYETQNVYIEIDEEDHNNDGFPDNYTFFFTDGRMFDNDANVNGSSGDFLFSLNTTRLVFLHMLVSDNPSLSTAFPSAGNTYIVSSTENTVVIHDGQIDPLTPPYLNNQIEFGVGNENIGTFHLPGAVGPTITINAMSLDFSNPENSTLDVDYTLMNTNGEIISGHYEGTFGVILD